MIASRLLIGGLLLGLSISACHRDTTTALQPNTGEPDADQALRSRELRTQPVTLTRASTDPSPRERAIIDRIVAMHSPSAATTLRRVLSDRYSELRLSSNPEAQALLKELSRVRATEIEDAPEPVEATVVLLDRLPDPSASAIVIRRKNAIPHDLIALPSGGATPAVLSAGIDALFRMRRTMGDVPQQDSRLVVGSTGAPKPWKAGLPASRLEADLADLKRGVPRQVMGLGKVRAINIPLKSMDARRSSPIDTLP